LTLTSLKQFKYVIFFNTGVFLFNQSIIYIKWTKPLPIFKEGIKAHYHHIYIYIYIQNTLAWQKKNVNGMKCVNGSNFI